MISYRCLKMKTVSLTPAEIMTGSAAGTMRRLTAMKSRLPEPYGWSSKMDPLATDIRSCLAEMAVAKAYGRYWVPATSEFRELAADVGEDIHVRSTTHQSGRLILHDRDKHGWYCLVLDSLPAYVIAGWIHSDVGIDKRFWTDPGTGRPAYFIPQSALGEGPF